MRRICLPVAFQAWQAPNKWFIWAKKRAKKIYLTLSTMYLGQFMV